MMNATVKLEDFANVDVSILAETLPFDTGSIKKEAFDEGYRAGWNDAFSEAKTEDTQAHSDIASALQRLDFTYFEARQHLMGSFRPLLDAMLKSVLPHASKESLVGLVQQELTTLTEMVEPPVKLICAPQNIDKIRAILDKKVSMSIDLVAEETLPSSQVQLCYPDGFSTLDTEATIKRIQVAITEFFHSPESQDQSYA